MRDKPFIRRNTIESHQEKLINHNIISVGHKMPDWIETGFHEYTKRMKDTPIVLKEIKPDKPTSQTSIAHIKKQEAQKIFALLPNQAFYVALDETGVLLSTEKLAAHIANWQKEHSQIFWVIGGAEGLDEEVRKKSNFVMSLSPLTFPHALVRVILAEQLYRAHSILNHHPYHRT